MLEITRGRTNNPVVTDELVEVLRPLSLDGSLYVGFPILATADVPITVDALLVTKQNGLVVFSFSESPPDSPMDLTTWHTLSRQQDHLFMAVENDLRQHSELLERRSLRIEVHAITLIPRGTIVPDNIDGGYAAIHDLPELLTTFDPLEEKYFRPLQAALQRVTTIKPTKRRATVISDESYGAVLKSMEKEIANLDQWQKRAAMECPDGEQRIRGLAGSGKTIVLALKAAYLHAYYPDWVIGVSFFSRSLYQQFGDLIRRFSYAHSNDEPNWDNLRILHAWGGRNRPGVYSQIATHCGITPRNLIYGRERYGRDREFEGVCSELWSAVEATEPEPIFDVMLIDEAQDCPAPFFKLVHKFTRSPKRVVWAYDELQNLSEDRVPSIEDQFGTNSQGLPNVNLADTASQDIVLPICYRNTPWALTLAHGLGLGTARTSGLVQSFDDMLLWSQIGYRLIDGQFQEGEVVTLERSADSYPEYFKKNITPEDAVSSHVFHDVLEQARWIAGNIKINLEEDELDPDDILIVLPNALSSRREAQVIIDALWQQGINAHLVGVGNSQDEVFQQNSVAIAHIYRSKGNEAPMVYVANAQHCVAGPGLITRRNTLFTAITRSKAWVRICGWGPDMWELQAEIEAIKNNDYRAPVQNTHTARIGEHTPHTPGSDSQ